MKDFDLDAFDTIPDPLGAHALFDHPVQVAEVPQLQTPELRCASFVV